MERSKQGLIGPERISSKKGNKADLVLVDDTDPDLPCAVLTLRDGVPVFNSNGLLV